MTKPRYVITLHDQELDLKTAVPIERLDLISLDDIDGLIKAMTYGHNQMEKENAQATKNATL